MSAWRIVVKNLYDAGGRGTAALAGGEFLTPYQAGNALESAAKRGLVSNPGQRGLTEWRLTQLGIDWCENRVTHVEKRPGGRRWVLTWLSALPRGIRLGGAA
jgi:hypothetical protein